MGSRGTKELVGLQLNAWDGGRKAWWYPMRGGCLEKERKSTVMLEKGRLEEVGSVKKSQKRHGNLFQERLEKHCSL